MIQREDIKTLYSDYDKRTISFLENVILGIGGTAPDYFNTNLMLLADQLEIYFRASDKVRENPIVCTTQKGPRQTPELDVMQKSWSHIVALLKDTGLTKYSQAKIERLKTSDNTEDVQQLVELLTK